MYYNCNRMGIEEIESKIIKGVQSGEINNANLVQLIELCGGYLNLQTISDYAKSHNMTYNGVKKFRNNVTIFNTKFIIDND